MALSATFDADFSTFYSAVNTAKDLLRDLGGEAETVGQELSQVVDSDAPQQMSELANATNEAAQANESVGVSLGNMVAAYVSAEAIIAGVTAAFHAFTDLVSESVTSAMDAEDAQARLAAALANQGTAMPSVLSAYDEYAAALQKTTIYSDDAATAAMALLAQIGGVMPRDMQRAIQVTADLASVMQTDLSSAALAMAKAVEGQTGALHKAGIEIDTTKGSALTFGEVLDQVAAKTHDHAEMMGNTFAGQLKKQENAWDNVKESIGRAITANETVRTALAEVNKLFVANTGELNKNATGQRLISDAVILTVKGFGFLIDALDIAQRQMSEVRITIDALGVTFHRLATAIAFASGQFDMEKLLAATQPRIKAFQDDIAATITTSTRWHENLTQLQTNLGAFVVELEKTRGKTVEVTAAEKEAPGVWDLQTGAISAQTMAVQEHAQALEGLHDKYVKIGTDVTAAARATEAAAVTEVAARDQAEAAFGQMHDAEEKALFQTSVTADTTVAAVNQISGAVAGLSAQLAPFQAGAAFSQIAPSGTIPLDQLRAIAEGRMHVTGGQYGMSNPQLLQGQRYWDQWTAQQLVSGAGGGVTIQSGAIQMQYPIMNDPTAMNNLARVVGDAIMKRMTGSGATV